MNLEWYVNKKPTSEASEGPVGSELTMPARHAVPVPAKLTVTAIMYSHGRGLLLTLLPFLA
jgi:hypothetical protein